MLIKKSLRIAVLIVCAIATTLNSQAQTLENLNTTFDGEKVSVTYDLTYSDPAQKFKVLFYSSHDNFSSPLSFLSGDMGEHVAPGKSKRVVWEVKNTLPANFDADVTVKIKATRVMPAVAPLMLKPLDVSVYKRGRTVQLRWEGGSPSDKVNIELYKNDVVQLRLADKIDNKQSYTWQMPKKQKAGNDYQMRISNAAKPGELAKSQNFQIKPRVPFIVKVLPLLAVGAVVALMPKAPPETTVDENLPGPTKPN